MSWPWSVLGLDGPSSAGDIKQAYAQKVKIIHPEEDPEGFQKLYAAYQAARRFARTAGNCPPAVPGCRADLPAEPGEETVFDFEALLAEGNSEFQPSSEAAEEEEAVFDFESLLAEGSGEPQASPKAPECEDWDYEALFAEGDEERRQARQRKAQERLSEAQARRKAQEKAQRDRALESEEAWSAAYAALHALEVLWSAGAAVEQWVLFLHSSTFLNAQHNLDFIFGLEDFLTEHPWLPDEIKRHIFLVYKFYNGKPDAVYLGLYRLLKSSGQSAGKKDKIPWRKRVFRQERAPIFILWILLSVLFIDYFFLSGAAAQKGPEAGSIENINVQNVQTESGVPPASDSPPVMREDEPPDETQQGIEAVHTLAIALAAYDYPGIYAVTKVGLSESGDDPKETYYWAQCSGQTESGETLVMNYFLSMDGTQVYCVPDEQNAGAIYLEPAGATAAGGKTVAIYRCPESLPDNE